MLKRAFPVRTACLVLFLVIAFGVSSRTEAQTKASKPEAAEEPIKVTLCELQKNPTAFDHKLVEVTGVVSHGFEDFTLFDLACDDDLGIWLEYGGKRTSRTVYCCGVVNGRTRPAPLVVDGVSTSLVMDEPFKRFDELMQSNKSTLTRVTLEGRFFAKKVQKDRRGDVLGQGYGHFGAFSLLVIRKVAALETHHRTDLDYEAETDQPENKLPGYSSRSLILRKKGWSWMSLLKTVESEDLKWAYDDPKRVATDALVRLLEVGETKIRVLEIKRTQPGRVVYEWKLPDDDKRYVVVVSRPFVLSFYARDPDRVPWITVGVFEVSPETK